jgi:hypothetical protein
MEELYKEASELAGRTVEVESTRDGQYIVLFMVMGKSPPPKGKDEREALERFITWAKEHAIHQVPEVDLHADPATENHRPAPRDTVSEF